jgi:hypothetical protein
MKKLILIILLLPLFAKAQVNGSIQRTAATGVTRYFNSGAAGIDTLASVTGNGVNGYVLVYNSTLKKSVWTNPTGFGTNFWSRNSGTSTLSPAIPNDKLNMGTGSITGGVGSFTSSGSTGAATITQSSGSGVGLTITKGGNGEGLIVNKTSGSGNAVTVTGTAQATTLVKTGGTGAQFLMGNGTTQDTTTIQTVANFFPKGDTRYAKTADLSGYVPASRTISAGNGLSGGGDLSGNRTISADTTVLRTVANSVSLSGLQTRLNNYLPLVAGVSNKLTGDLYVNTASNPALILGSNATMDPFIQKGSSGEFYLGSNNLTRIEVSTSGNIDFKNGAIATGGTITSSNPIIFGQLTAGSSAAYGFFKNTGGEYYIGANNSTGTSFGSNVPYAYTLYAPASTPFVFGQGSNFDVYKIDESGNNTWSGSGNFGDTLTAPSIKLTTGATSGYYLQSDGSGNATWQPIGSSYKGTWDASANTPTLADGTGTAGDYYIVSTGGTQFGRTFVANGQAIYSGTIWQPTGTATGVTSFASRTGAVTAQSADYSSFYPSLTGTGASGNWGINITGNAASSTSWDGNTYSGGTIVSPSLFMLYDTSPGAWRGGTVSDVKGMLGYGTTLGSNFTITEDGSNVYLQTFSSKPLVINGSGNAVSFGANITASNFSGSSSGTNTGDQTTITGNAGTATALQTARTIQGVSFDGTANINPINGTGFVKATGTTLSYDNTTYAPLNSPTFTGTPSLPTGTTGVTQTAGDNSTKLATTAYVDRLAGGTVTSGTYTPTLTNELNVSGASNDGDAQYTRIGNIVTVYGSVSFTQTSSGNCLIGISLPIASNFTVNTQAYGVGVSFKTVSTNSVVSSDSINDRASLSFIANSGDLQTFRYSFSYQIL